MYERFKKCLKEYAYYQNDNAILHALEHCLQYDEFRRRWESNSVSQVCAALQRPIVSKRQYSTKFGNMVHVKFSLIFANLCLYHKFCLLKGAHNATTDTSDHIECSNRKPLDFENSRPRSLIQFFVHEQSVK